MNNHLAISEHNADLYGAHMHGDPHLSIAGAHMYGGHVHGAHMHGAHMQGDPTASLMRAAKQHVGIPHDIARKHGL
jgi:hypothetical protein